MKTTRVPQLILAMLLSLGLVLSACGEDRPTNSAQPAGTNTPDTKTNPPTPAETTSPAPEKEERASFYEVWFHARERLAPAYYEHAATPRIGTAALEDLFAGPRGSNLGTSIPQGTELLGLAIQSGIATVDLSAEFEAPSGSLSERVRLGQVVFTLTQFPTVDGVVFEVEGERVEVFGSHGLDIREPQTRADFEDVAPAILVDSPRPGARVSSPIVITGNANVFEATVSIRILDANGAVIKEAFTTATCGTGCRGDYETKVSLAIDEAQDGTVMVYESSAENGRPINVVKIPVTLLP